MSKKPKTLFDSEIPAAGGIRVMSMPVRVEEALIQLGNACADQGWQMARVVIEGRHVVPSEWEMRRASGSACRLEWRQSPNPETCAQEGEEVSSLRNP